MPTLRTALFLLLAVVLIGVAVLAWLGRLPLKVPQARHDPDTPFYFVQPPARAIVCAGLGIGFLHLAVHARFSFLVMLALPAGIWLGLVGRMMLARAEASGEEPAPLPWWQRELAGAVLGGLCVAAAVWIVAGAGSNPVTTLVSVPLVVYGLVAAGRWMGAVAAGVIAGEVAR